MTMLLALVILAIVLLITAAPDVHRPNPGPSWFDLQPYLVESKSRRGRAQQTRRHGTRRYGY
ncbi:MAG: hypothetical protein ACRDT9_00185 [Agromyces sp.]